MKHILTVTFVILVVGVFLLPSMAQSKKWTYHANNGASGEEREEITITITQGANGYQVSGTYLTREGRSCSIRGQYFPRTERFKARSECEGGNEQIVVEGFKRGSDLQITDPWSAVATLEGTKREPGGNGEVKGKHIGCFRDSNNPFDLDRYLERSQTNTPQKCVETCREKGFKYAGVQFGESCLCGNSYGSQGSASNCDMPCTGDKSQKCGGRFANSVYATGLP